MKKLSLLEHSILIFLKRNIPFLTCFLLILFGLIPFRITFLSHFAIPLAYIGIFYWTVFTPYLMTPTTVFFLGLSTDLLTISPLGYHSFLFLCFYWLILANRRFLEGRPFIFLWTAFCAATFPLAFAQWLLASLLNLSWLSLWFFLTQSILLIAIYPFVASLCALFYMRFLDEG